MTDEEIYDKLAQRRYNKSYDGLDNTQKFVLEMDFDRFNS